MCCGNNSKFKQLSLGKSGNCLEISQEQTGFCYSSFLLSFHRYFNRNIFSSYYYFSCCHLNIPKAKIRIKLEKIILIFRYFRHFCLTFVLVGAKAAMFHTLCMACQCFICSRSKGKVQLCLHEFICVRSAMKLTHGIAAVQGRGACRSVRGETSLHPLQQCKHNFSPLADFY